MFLVVLSLCVASCLAKPSIGYSYLSYAPSSPLSHSYAPYQSILTPYALRHSALVYNSPLHIPAAIKTQYHTGNIHDTTSYGHTEPLQSHHAVQDSHGNKVGSFSYVKPDGQIHRTDYIADAAGYRAASNDLPIGPSAPAAAIVAESPIIVNAAAVPGVPHETPEVIAAKAAHFAAHAQARAHLLYKRSVYSYAPAPIVQSDGHLADTPEVAAAKVAHFAEHAKRGNHYVAPYAAAAVAAPHNNYYPYLGSYYNLYAHHQTPVVTSSGYLADTPEVAAAKAAHYAEKAKVSHYNAIPAPTYNHIPTYSHVPSAVAYPQIGPDGHVLDTPEVAAAKAAHLSEHIAAAARNAALSVHEPAPVYPTHAPYSSPYYASPVVNPDGHLADTPEVAHAKAAHLAEYAAIASRQKRSVVFAQTPAHTVPLAAPIVPYAAAPLLHAPHVPTPYNLYPILKPAATYASVVHHGPHAISYANRV